MKEVSGRVRFLSEDERVRLLEACKASHDPRLYPLVLMAISTGARWGELSALRWSQVDLERGYALIEHSKNGDRRSLPLAGPLLAELEEMARMRRIETDLLFAGAAGTVHCDARRVLPPLLPIAADLTRDRQALIARYRAHSRRFGR